MEKLGQYRVPLIVAVGTLIVIAVVFVAWISPEDSKLSSLHAQQSKLQTQQVSLQAEIQMLQHEQEDVGPTCSLLTQELAEVPGTPTVDSFLRQVSDVSGRKWRPKHTEHQRYAGDWDRDWERRCHRSDIRDSQFDPCRDLRSDVRISPGSLLLLHCCPPVHDLRYHDQRGRRERGRKRPVLHQPQLQPVADRKHLLLGLTALSTLEVAKSAERLVTACGGNPRESANIGAHEK